MDKETGKNKTNLLCDLVPEARKFFDFEKNEGIDFESLTIASTTKCYWKCPRCAREIYASANARVKKESDGLCRFRVCRECSQKERGEKSEKRKLLVDLLPDVINYFDFEKNKDIDIESLTIASTTKCYWKCPSCGREIYASANARVKKESDGSCRFRVCRECNQKQQEEKSEKRKLLVDLFPDVINYFDFEKNKDIDIESLTIASETKCYWKCPSCDREIYASANARVKKKSDGSYRFGVCRACSHKRQWEKSEKRKSLVDLFPDVVNYFDFEKNKDIDIESLSIASQTKCYWKCPCCGREFYSSVHSKVNKDPAGSYHFGCSRECSGVQQWKKAPKKNLLVDAFPEARGYFDYDKNKDIDIESLYVRGTTKCYWKCPGCGREQYASSEEKITKDDSGQYHFSRCRDCALKYARAKQKRKMLIDLFPEAKEHFDFEKNKDIEFESLTIADATKCYWNCPICGEELYSSVKDRVEKNRDGSYRFMVCLTCARVVAKRKSSLPHVAQVDYLMQKWDVDNNPNLDPNELTVGANNMANWVCRNCSYQWHAPIHRVYHSSGNCPVCDGRNAIVPGVTDVFSLVPQAKEYYCSDKNENIDITHMGISSGTEVWWRCPNCGSERKCAIKNKIQRNSDGTYSIRTCNKCLGKAGKESHLTDNLDERKEKQFVSDNADIMKFWDWSKNVGLDPATILAGSYKAFVLTCPNCNYSWTTSARNLTSRVSICCVCCESWRATAIKLGVNDVFTKVPGLRDYYDFEKNKDIDIETITVSSHTKAWWKCPHCQDEAYIAFGSKITKKDGQYVFRTCKRCFGKGKKTAPDKPDEDNFDIQDPPIRSYRDYGGRSLAALHPQVAANWSWKNRRPPSSVLPNATFDVYWTCPICHLDYSAKVCDAVNGYSQCPTCNNRRVQPGYNTVEDVYPDLAKRWSPNNRRKPNEILSTSSYNALWICNSCGGEHSAPVKDMAAGIADCPFCNDREAVAWEASLAARPDIAAMWSSDNDRPADNILATSAYTASWICRKCNGEFNASVRDVVNGVTKCPYCSGKRLLPGLNSLADTHPDIAAMWSPSNDRAADSVLATSCYMVSWICKECGGEYNAYVKDVVDGTAECPFCNGRRVLPGLNSLADTHPDIAAMWSPNNERTADSVFATSSIPASWICKECEGEYNAPVKDVVDGTAECPYCSGKRLLPGLNSLADTHPDIAAMWSPNNERTADSVFATSSIPASWICKECGGEYNAPVKDVVDGTAECPYCSGRKALPGFNSLADTHPDIAAMWSPNNERTADSVLARSSILASWICKECGGEYNALAKDVVDGTAECPYCSGRKALPGFNSLAVQYSDIALEWDAIKNYAIGMDPDNILPNNATPVWWICEKGHKYRMSTKNRVLANKRHQVACGYCKGRRRERRHFV